MKNLFILFLILVSVTVFCQEAVAPPMSFSKNEKLSLDAYKIFKANKFLDFANADTLKEIIYGKVVEITTLKNYFSYQKDWVQIQAEDTSTYRRKFTKHSPENYDYTYTDSTMTECYLKGGAYGVHKEFKTVYNLKGFLTEHEIKVFIDENYVETRRTVFTFDNKNRATKIIESVTKKKSNENSKEIITAIYEPNQITVSSENGEIKCLFSQKLVVQKPRIKHLKGQDKNIYRSFNGKDDLTMSIAVNNDEVIISEYKHGLETIIKERIFPTKIANLFYVDIHKMQYKNPNQGNYYLLAMTRKQGNLSFSWTLDLWMSNL